MARPSKLPEWATDGGADIVEPSSAEKGTGHEDGDTLEASTENWVKNLVYQWLAYFDEAGHDEVTLNVPAIPGTGDWLESSSAQFVYAESSSQAWFVNVPLREGDRVKRVRFRVEPDGSSGDMSGSVDFMKDGSSETSISAVDSSTGSTPEYITVDNIDRAVGAGEFLRLQVFSGTGSNTREFYHAEVDIDRPLT